MSLRCEQKLFIDIVRQSYEAFYAWRKWIKEYCVLTEKERNAYILFSGKIREGLDSKISSSSISNIVFERWCGLDDNEWNKWINESENLLKSPFRDVDTFLNTFSHHC